MVDVMSTSLQNIEQKLDNYFINVSIGNLNTTESFDDGLSWPIEKEDQLEELEHKLQKDENHFKSSLVSYNLNNNIVNFQNSHNQTISFFFQVNKMSLMNSTTVERSIRRILKYMFTDDLLEHYSYTGFKKPKKSFSKLLSCQIIIGM